MNLMDKILYQYDDFLQINWYNVLRTLVQKQMGAPKISFVKIFIYFEAISMSGHSESGRDTPFLPFLLFQKLM